MRKKFIVISLLALIAFAIPIEHKYDKLFRFFSMTLIPQGLEISPNYDPKIFFYLSDIASLLLLFVGLKFKNFFKSPLWIVFICALVSIFTSPFATYPICYTRLLQLLSPIILYSFLANGFNCEEKSKATKAILIALAIASFFQSMVAIAQYIHQAPLGLRFFGETTLPTYFQMFKEGKSIDIMRSSGTFSHANPFGGFMVLSILSTYGLLSLLDKKKWIVSLLLPLQILALSLSFSRSALFAWVIGTLVWFSFLIFKKENRTRSLRKLIIITALSFTAVFIGLFNQLVDRGGVVNYNRANQLSDSVRLYHQKKALQIIQENPFFGLGFSQFSERSAKYLSDQKDTYIRSTAPHNIFLFLATETGLISLFCFLVWIVSLLRKTIKSKITVESATFASIFIAFLFIGLCDFYPILFQEGRLMFFIAAGLLSSHLQPSTQLIEEVS